MIREADSPIGIAEIAQRLGVHANTVRFHLDALVANGQVTRTTAESGSPGRPAQLFEPAAGMDPMGPRRYDTLAAALATGLAADPDHKERALKIGRLWGRLQATEAADSEPPGVRPDTDGSVERLRSLLDELGFEPEQMVDDDNPRIGLRNCPFLELVSNRADVICPVHLGLMQGAMDTWKSPITVDRLDAFAEPDLCVAHLSTISES